jgi:uncharacterized protein (DUF885 family)
MKFLALKRKAQEELAHEFDVRKFHDVVLGEGALPLNELDALVEDYIKLEREKN